MEAPSQVPPEQIDQSKKGGESHDSINISCWNADGTCNMPSRDTAPFIYDVTTRTLKGAGIGLALGFIFFKGSKMRRFCTYYGAGFGIGMSYNQISTLYGKLIGCDGREMSKEEKLEDL